MHGSERSSRGSSLGLLTHRMVPTLMDNLFNWMNEAKENVNPLILSSIFHYEFVFIHPFRDGNGRTARLWQNVILSHSLLITSVRLNLPDSSAKLE